jgi:16S rRNA (uracil1498-N3)-methyltransferase
MPRFFLGKISIIDNKVILREGQAGKIRSVLRLKVGDRINLFDGKGGDYLSVIKRLDSKEVELEIIESSFSEKRLSPEIFLGQALPKGKKMDMIVQKATELGVAAVFPFISTRAISRPKDENKWRKRIERWQKIAEGAAEQCGRMDVPRVENVLDFTQFLEKSKEINSLRLLFWEKEGRGLKEILKRHKKEERIFVLVGPEGGFSEEEVNLAKNFNFSPVSLGKRILRVETATLAILSILQHEIGDMGEGIENKGSFPASFFEKARS